MAPQLVIWPPPKSLHRALLGFNLDDPIGFASCIDKCPTLLDVKRQGLLGVDISAYHASFDARSNALELGRYHGGIQKVLDKETIGASSIIQLK